MDRLTVTALALLLFLGSREAEAVRSPLSVARPPAAAAWSWPLTPRPTVTRPFQAPPHPWAAGHRGVDLRASTGQSVLSPAAGQVSFSGQVAGRMVVVIDHGAGLRSTFEPVRAPLSLGSTVSRGDSIAEVSGETSHCGSIPCLHWGVIQGQDYLDPLSLLRTPHAILLPLRLT